MKYYLRLFIQELDYIWRKEVKMKSLKTRQEEFADLVHKKNRESIIEGMYESCEIFDREDELSMMEVYENLKIVVEEQIKKKKIKNIKRWLYMMIDPNEERMMDCIRKYCREVIDKENWE